MNAQPPVAELVATFLAEHGVRRVYGVTGGEVLRLLDALHARGVKFILTHHESSAAYMADTEGQLSGRPGVCISTLGPGAVNLLPGLAQATLERSPVLAITADPSDAERAVRTHQVLDIRGAMQPLVKLSLQVTRENVWQALPAAWEAAGSGRPGAAHLAIPASVSEETAVPGAWQVPTPETLAEPDPDAIDDLCERLLAAERPAAVLGLEGRDPAVAAAFQNVVETLDLPVATQLKAKGWFPGDHPLHAGTVASYGARGVFELLSESDLILGVGMDGVDFIREWPAGEVDLLTARADHDPSFPNRPVRGSLVAMLEHLTDVVAPQRATRGVERARAARQAALDDLRARTGPGRDPPDAPPGGIAIHDLFGPLRPALGPDVALIPDVGLHKLYLAQYWSVPGPQAFLVANGLSAMGWAVPSALAYKLEFPRRPVIAVVGDGGLLMYAGELATLAGLAPSGLVVVVLNDASLALIHAKAEELDLDVSPNDFKPPDFVALARSFDLEAGRATSSGHAVELITQGLQRPHPVIVEVPLAFGPYRRMA